MKNQIWNILLVEDDEDDFTIIRSLLDDARQRKVKIRWARSYADGKQAIMDSLMTSEPYDAILMDDQLGDGRGLDLIREAKALNYPAPILLVAHQGSYELDLQAMQAGAADYLNKQEVTAPLLERSVRYAIERHQAEQRILYQSILLENAHDAIIAYDTEMRITSWNRAAEELYGWPAAQVLGKQLFNVIPTELDMADHRSMQVQLEQSGRYQIELYQRTRDGRKIFTGCNTIALHEQNDQVSGFVMVIRDLTHRKIFEKAIQQDHAHLSETIRGMTDAFVSIDADWRYLEVNEIAEREFLNGRLSSEVVGKSIWEIYPDTVGDLFFQKFQEAAQTGQPQHFEACSKLNQKWYEVHCYPREDRLDIYHRDISERKNTELERERLLEQIYTERARLETVLQALPVGVWIADPQGRITGKNRQADRDWAGDAPLPQSVAEYSLYNAWWSDSGEPLKPEDWPLAQILREQQPLTNQKIDIQRLDGTRGTILCSAAPIFDAEGRLIGAVAVNQDITAQSELEATLQAQKHMLQKQKRELQNKNQQLQGMFDHAPAALAMFSAEAPYQVLATNNVYQQIWPEPFQSEGLVGRYLTDFIPQAEEAGVLPVFREVVETGQGKTLYHFAFDGLPQGRTWWDWDLSPVHEEGQLVAFVLVAVDVTSEVKARHRLEQELVVRQRFEEALWASENRLRRLIDANIIGIYYATVEGRITDANDAFLETVGYTREDLQAGEVSWKAMTPPEYAAVDEQGVAEARERGACTPYEKEYIRKDGQRVPIFLGYALFEGAANEYITFVLDMSELKQAEEQVRHYAAELERSNRDLQDFAFIASHDLQEPLRKFNAFSGRLEARFAHVLDDEGRDYLQRMQRAAERMQSMINDLLAYSRVTTRGQPFMDVDLNRLAQEVVNDLEVRIEQSGGEVRVDRLPIIEADPLQIQHLLQNLIGNALKFHRQGVPPVVEVTGRMTSGDQIELVIADNGIGFNEQHLERIFQPFQRLHGRSQYEGSGMGLAICRKIIERHAGEITAKSVPGEGSRFIVRLPVKH